MTEILNSHDPLDEESSKNVLIRELMDIGLTKNESRAYLKLITFESLTASELVYHTGIPDSKIYYIMDSLQKKGLIILQQGVPKKYIAISPVDALENIRVKIKGEYRATMSILDRLGHQLSPIYQKSEDLLKIAYIVKSKNNILNQAKRLISEAANDIILMLPNLEMYELLEKTINRVKDRVVIKLGFFHENILLKPLPYDVTMINCECFFLIIDSKILLTVSKWIDEESYAILTTDVALIEVSKGYFSSPCCTFEANFSNS